MKRVAETYIPQHFDPDVEGWFDSWFGPTTLDVASNVNEQLEAAGFETRTLYVGANGERR